MMFAMDMLFGFQSESMCKFIVLMMCAEVMKRLAITLAKVPSVSQTSHSAHSLQASRIV
jgi:hypothetical protein